MKALDLKKLQSPLYEEFYSTMNAMSSQRSMVGISNGVNIMNLPPKSKSPKRLPSRRLSAATTASPGSQMFRVSNVKGMQDRALQEIHPPQHNEWKEASTNGQKEMTNSRLVN